MNICIVNACDKVASRRKMCEMHYRRFRRNGDTDLQPSAVSHPDGTQTCSRCSVRQPFVAFVTDGRLSRGRRAICNSCELATRRARYERNGEHYRAESADWRARNPDRMRKYAADAYERHREKYLEWATKGVHRRRAVLAGVERDKGVTVRALRKRDGDDCCYCMLEMTFEPARGRTYIPGKATLEHIIPLARGGGHTWANTTLACWQCNLRKNVRTLDEWRGGCVEVDRLGNSPDLDAFPSTA